MASAHQTRGATTITERAVRRIVAAAVDSVPGIVPTSARGLDRMTKRSYPHYEVLMHPVQHSVSITITIAVSWPAPVIKIATAVQDAVCTWVERMTGLQVTTVNVDVGPVLVNPERLTQAHVDARPQMPTVKDPVVHSQAVSHPDLLNSNKKRIRSISAPQPLTLRPVHVSPRK